jgi:hypothetical protein
MSIRKFYTFRVNDITPDDHTGRLGEITYRNGFLYYHDGSTPGGEIIGGGGSGSGGPTSWSSVTGKPSFAAVATSGSYADLIGKPTIPSKVSDLTNDSGFITSVAWADVSGKPALFSGAYADLTGKPTLFSGSYTDLTNKPTIPSLAGYATEAWVNSQGFGSGGGGTGAQGPAGADGADGQDGASAYEVAVANGFVGNESAWLASLVGAQGPQGPAGGNANTGNIVFDNDTLKNTTSLGGEVNIETASQAGDLNKTWSFNHDGAGSLQVPIGSSIKATHGLSILATEPEFVNFTNVRDFDTNSFIQFTELNMVNPQSNVLAAIDPASPDCVAVAGAKVRIMYESGMVYTCELTTGFSPNGIDEVSGTPLWTATIPYINIGSLIKEFSIEHSANWRFAPNGKLQLPLGGDIVDSTGASVLGGGSGAQGLQGPKGDTGDTGPAGAQGPQGERAEEDRLVNGAQEVVLNSDGTLTTPAGLSISKQLDGNAVHIGSSIQSDFNKNLRLQAIGTGSGSLAWQNFEGDANFVTLNYNQSKNIMITVGNAVGEGVLHNWLFASTGNIQLPPGGDIVDIAGNSVLGGGSSPTNEITNTHPEGPTYSVSVGTDGVVTMVTSRGNLEFGALPEEGAPQHLHIMRPAGQEGSSDLYFGDDYNYVKLPGSYGVNTLGVEIGSNDGQGGSTSVWRFGTEGNIVFPDGSIQTTAYVPTTVASSYKGFSAHYGRLYDAEPNVSKIVIYKDSVTPTSTIDTSTNDDDFSVAGLSGSDVVAMFVVYGSDSTNPKTIAELKTFTEAVIDNVILDEGVEGDTNSINSMKNAFYDNYETLADAVGGNLYSNFQFHKSIFAVNGSTTVLEGSGATFDVTANDGAPGVYTVRRAAGGTNYKAGHKIKILGTQLGGTTPANDLIITVGIADGISGEIGLITYTEDTADGGAQTEYNGVSGTNIDVGSGFTVTTLRRNNDGTVSVDNVGNFGSNYVMGDVITIPGNNIADCTSPENDITLTVNFVFNGQAQGFLVSGSLPGNLWPSNYIDDGGSDQYDTGNYINTDLYNEISYNNGDIAYDANNEFGSGSNYVVVYNNSIFGVLATGAGINTIGTGGNSGFDGDGRADTGSVYGAADSGVNIGDFVFNGSILTATDNDGNLYIKAGDDLWLDALEDDIHIRANDDVRIKVGYDFQNDSAQSEWRFSNDGIINFPDGSQQSTAYTGNSFSGNFYDLTNRPNGNTAVHDLIGGASSGDNGKYLKQTSIGVSEWADIPASPSLGALTISANTIQGGAAGQVGNSYTKTVDVNGNNYSTGAGSIGFLNFGADGEVEQVKAGWTVTFASGETRTVAQDAWQPLGTYWNISFNSAFVWDAGDVMPITFSSPDYVAGSDPAVVLSANNKNWTFDDDGNLTLPTGGDIVDSTGASVLGGGGTSLPANASGYLNNNGSGTLSWVAGNPTGSGMLPYNGVTVLSNTVTADWTEYTLSGTMDAFYDWNNNYTTITLSSQTAYGKQITPNTKNLWINDSKINSNNYLVVEFPATPSVGDVFSVPVVNTLTTVSAGSFVVGETYTIVSAGTTNWTSIGAQYGGAGQSFVATGVGSGTGTATTSAGAKKLIFKPASGHRAHTMAQGSLGSIVFGQGGTYDFMYIDLGGMNAGNPITWVYAGLVNSIPTWYQFYF